MRKMFSRLFTVMILLVFAIAYQANASPPDDTGTMYTEQVVTADVDNFVINVPTIDAAVYTIEMPVVPQVKNLSDKEAVFVTVREVTTCRKISTLKAESGSATENAAIALNTACTCLNNVIQSPPLPITASVATNKNYFDLQHTNYGYPLSAN